MEQSAWSVLPPVITIVLALLTKEVYMSLLIGIFSGALIYAGGNPLEAIVAMFEAMEEKVGGNVNILVFLVTLGILVAAISKSGATRAYGEWARSKINGKRSALGLTALLGVTIFIDDYFNCLTVGTVMRPVTDNFKIARAKLAYVIDATAAPICIIAPVSSWAAAVGSSLPEGVQIDGFTIFLETIPFNLYAWLTMAFMIFIIISGRDFATMGRVVRENKRSFVIPEEYKDAVDDNQTTTSNGRIVDLVLPLIVLIGACIYGMLYTGGINNEGVSIADAFADCDSSKALVIGSFIAFVFTAFLYLPRGVVKFSEFCECFTQGFKAMMPAVFILCLAWTLSGICSAKYLNLGGYVGALVLEHMSVMMFLPLIFFSVALGLAFATGTSWGTFGILIPIAMSVLFVTNTDLYPLFVLCVAAILSGAVAGDHASPISDTTILASAGAQCNHLEHVETQVPYVLTVSICCVIGYIVDGFTWNGWLGLAAGGGALALAMAIISAKVKSIDAE